MITGVRTVTARVQSCTGDPVRRIILATDGPFPFKAGQYLELGHTLGPKEVRIPLSIASAPRRLPRLDVHFLPEPGNAHANLVEELLDLGEFPINGPFGDVYLDGPPREPLLIVAGGTGSAQAFGLLDELLNRGLEQPVRLLWCATESSLFYGQSWLHEHAGGPFSFELIADARRNQDNRAMVRLKSIAPQLGGGRIILSGGPGFVHAASEVLQAEGVPRTQLCSDVFSYA